MQNQPRGQHYVPRFYVASFANAEGLIHVIDQQRRKQWTSVPEQVAKENHFYTLRDSEFVDPYVVERALADLEADCAPLIRDIVTNRSLPSGRNMNRLISFIAMMFCRVPGIKNDLSTFLNDESELIDFAWQEIAKQQTGSDASIYAKREWFDQLHANESASNCNQSTYVKLMMDMVPMLIPLLAKRHWSLWDASDAACDLICSDSPVNLVSTEQRSDFYPPGFDSPGTVVTIPLTTRLAIVGTIAPCAPYKKIGENEVADLNFAVGSSANQLYMSEPDFAWRMRDRRIGRTADLLSALCFPS
jgi:hypothetical protein